MRVLAAAIVASICAELRDTLPRTEEGAGMFVSGMCYALLIFMALLVGVTWLWAKAHGVAL